MPLGPNAIGQGKIFLTNADVLTIGDEEETAVNKGLGVVAEVTAEVDRRLIRDNPAIHHYDYNIAVAEQPIHWATKIIENMYKHQGWSRAHCFFMVRKAKTAEQKDTPCVCVELGS